MNLIKNKLCILILFASCILPLGGIGISGIQNSLSMNGTESEGDFILNFESNGSESGLNIFIYFDALPNDLAVEYNRELKFQPLSTTMILSDQNIKGELSSFRVSDYLTVRKEVMGLSIPVLAKAALHIGAGLNQHRTVIPSINLLKDIYDVNNIDDLYNQANESWDGNSFIGKLANNSTKSNGAHIQVGIQGKLLTLNVFANAKYTFILNDDKSSIESFPGLNIGIAFGI